MDNYISNYTKLFVDKLPYWFKIKKKPNESIGLQFLNAFGLEYDDMRYILEYAFRQTYINEMDTDYLNVAFKGYLNNFNSTISSVSSNSILLEEAKDLNDFFNITFDYYENKDNYDRDVYIIDTDKGILYVKKEYDKNNKYKYGKVVVKYESNEEEIVQLMPHSVWNYFDEVGLLINCQRLEGESNFDYKERLLNVFKFRQGSDMNGVLNSISNELGIRKTVIWEDTLKDLVLKDNMIILDKISINGSNVPIENLKFNDYGNVILKGNRYYSRNIEVSYIKDIEVHFLFDKKNKKLDSELFCLDSKPTELMKTYFNKIHAVSPIVWDKFVWDKAYWNITDKTIGGIAFIPSLLDGNINGFEGYLKK